MTKVSTRIPVAVLGATGMVGQRLIEGLANHAWFRLAEVVASERSAGKLYKDATQWRLPSEMPHEAAELVVKQIEAPLESSLIFSGLGAEIARPLEERLANEGKAVVSNASAHRMGTDIPLLIPEVNPGHLELLSEQRRRRGGSGLLVTNPNCSTIGLVLALAPIHQAFGLEQVAVVTLQALSGAGFPGVPALSVADNVVPWISGEAEKIAEEPCKILGTLQGSSVRPAEITFSARVHRVPVRDGHCLTVFLKTKDREISVSALQECLRSFQGEPQSLGLPSAPKQPIHLLEGMDRPQPSLDRDREGGMAVSVGGVETCPILGFKFEVLVHNTIRCAAGAALLNAELLKAQGWLEPQAT